jgi:coatomer subunit beta
LGSTILKNKIVEKLNPDGKLKSEMILVCNSIRNDLLHANEYIRAKTLRMLTRVMHLGILEPLKPSILENLKHTCSYVRRNAVSLLYKIYQNFNGND